MTRTTSHRRAAQQGRETTSSSLSRQAEKQLIEERLDDYVMERVCFRAWSLADKFNLDVHRQDDFEQDMIVELLKAHRRYDPDGPASWHTYACRVLDLAVKKLTQRECRRIERESGRPIGLTDSPDGCPSAVNNPAYEGTDELELAEMRMDISVVFERMPERLRMACELLTTNTPTETAELMGIHRNSIYRLIAKAREYFEAAGLGFPEGGAADSARVRM